jgi:hypothetical protein
MMNDRGYSRERSFSRGDHHREARGEARGGGHHSEHAVADALRALARLRRLGGVPPALEPLCQLAPREGMDVHVAFRAEGHGSPEVHLSYRPLEHQRGAHPSHHDDYAQDEEPVPQVDPELALKDLLQLVARSEQDPRLQFIALKLLRDRILPQSGSPWALHPKVCQAVIGDAINRELLVTRKVPNPRNPDFPVTAVVLNRDNPALAKYLEGMPAAPEPEDEEHEEEDEEADDESAGEEAEFADTDEAEAEERS